MLILTRRPSEVIRVGEEITITLLGIRGNQVRIGIHAPRTIPVHRQEIYHRIQAEAERDHRNSRQSAHFVSMRVVSSDGEVRDASGAAGEGAKDPPSHDAR